MNGSFPESETHESKTRDSGTHESAVISAAAVVFDRVTFLSPDGRSILNGIDLSVRKGATTALLGRSGSGKTTMLRMVNRLLEPARGRILVEGRSTGDWDPIALRRSIGYVVQETGLLPHLNTARNVGMVPEISGRPKREIGARVRELLSLVGLDYGLFASRLPHQLSGGQRQRVGLARALGADPEILLLDEPFGALDPLTRAEMQDMLRALLPGLKKTALLVTHDLQEALYLASRIVFLEAGKVVAELSPEEVLCSEVPIVRQYVEALRRTSRAAPAVR